MSPWPLTAVESARTLCETGDAMDRYTPGFLDDLQVLAWYLHLGETGDMDTAFGKVANSLSVFLRLFEPPTELWYAHDESGWYGAAWLTPIMDGVTYSVWVREDHRQSKSGAQFITDTVAYAARTWPVVLFITRSDAVLKQGAHFGFTPLGTIPYLFDGDAAHVGVLTTFSHESATQPVQEASNGR